MTVSELPPFKWDPVAGADKYEFEFAADTGFNPATKVTTKNTRAALKLLVPNGTYYWRVRGVTSAGDVGEWSDVRSLDMAWTAQAALLAPSNGATITYPDHALELRWGAVQGAAKYLVKVASDPGLGTLVFGEPIETASTQFTLNDPMPPGTYYWGITPLNAQGHEGNPSIVASFTWSWPLGVDADVHRPRPPARARRPALLVDTGPRSGRLPGRGQLLLGLGRRLEGLLRRHQLPHAGLHARHLTLAGRCP